MQGLMGAHYKPRDMNYTRIGCIYTLDVELGVEITLQRWPHSQLVVWTQ